MVLLTGKLSDQSALFGEYSFVFFKASLKVPSLYRELQDFLRQSDQPEQAKWDFAFFGSLLDLFWVSLGCFWFG